MSTDLDAYRRYYAEDILICANLKTPALVEALAAIPRERFLPAGPWTIRGEADFQSPLRTTPSNDPRFIYHNIAVGIDPARMLFNGAPALLSSAIDALALQPGQRALHVGGGTGYYSGLMGHVVGSSGALTVVEVDEDLSRQAAANLAGQPWTTVRHGDGRGVAADGPFDAILVNAGVTHPEPEWLASLAPGGRLMLPLTTALGGAASVLGPAMLNISKGFLILITRATDANRYSARLVTIVAIYSALGLRDAAANDELGRAMARMPFPPLRRFRPDTDAHDADATCWCHTARGCWSTAE